MKTDELAVYLASFEESDSYRVDALLKESPLETTQRVYYVGADGSSLGPFVRKLILLESGLGRAYEAVFAAQRSGVRLGSIPWIVECGRRGDKLVVVMENVEGSTLDDRVSCLDGPGARLAFTRTIFGSVCDAVTELHECLDRPIVHRDLKPSNIMIGPSDAVTLIDLGIARLYREGGECDTTHFGTRSYAPPEQYGFGQTSVRSDVYSLGMLLFFCLAGREARMSDREAGFSGNVGMRELARVIARATQFDPNERYGTVRELKQAFLDAVPAEMASAEEGSSHLLQDGLLAWVPTWFGRAWNAILGLGMLVVLVGCVEGFLAPRGDIAWYPRWYRAAGYFVFIPVVVLSLGYMLMDRRRLRARFALLRKLTVLEESAVCMGAAVTTFLVFVLCSMAVGR